MGQAMPILAEQAGFDCRVEHVELDSALSIEHAAREARYQALQQHHRARKA
ncbi:ATP-binding protein [Salinivibrio socompensis]|uniref:ATP-binding protein n=1 Tax=Salinivibrio socompensis TaxID=1510206 RepID=UPI0004BB3538|nr:ATP-binding protein [Salinivibrio socompensis]